MQSHLRQLINLLKLAYSAEMAAALAYRGHWKSVKSPDEKDQIRKIEEEEWQHRKLIGDMLGKLNKKPSRWLEIKFWCIGRAIGISCFLIGWLAPMYGAGKLERGNIKEYEDAARFARDSGHHEWVDCLLAMAEVEWEHEKYFRSQVLKDSWGRKLKLWSTPPPKENIRESFAKND
jgi:rubrerythrin